MWMIMQPGHWIEKRSFIIRIEAGLINSTSMMSKPGQQKKYQKIQDYNICFPVL